MSVAMPAWRTHAKREKEAELLFRGQQYMRAIDLYQRQFPGAYPTDVEVLVERRLLRRAHLDPMTGEPFRILTPSSAAAAAGEGDAGCDEEDGRPRNEGFPPRREKSVQRGAFGRHRGQGAGRVSPVRSREPRAGKSRRWAASSRWSADPTERVAPRVQRSHRLRPVALRPSGAGGHARTPGRASRSPAPLGWDRVAVPASVPRGSIRPASLGAALAAGSAMAPSRAVAPARPVQPLTGTSDLRAMSAGRHGSRTSSGMPMRH